MKTSKIILGLFILITCFASIDYAQQQFIHTVTKQDCNATCSVIDIPELNGKPDAVVFITPSGGTSNPHPIGAYYMYQSKWSVFNLDATAIAIGAQFKVEYYVNPDANHFVYSILPRIHTGDPAYIDNAGLNNNPNAQIRVFPHISATIGNLWNKLDVKVEYDKTAAKWFIANLNATPISPAVAYNVMFSNAIVVSNPNSGKELNTKTPATTITNTTAGGDLSGNYPNPKVIGLQGRSLSNNQPAVGQVLKWNGSAWEPANENVTNTIPTVGQVLKWNGSAWEPADDNFGTAATPPAAPMQTFFKQDSNSLSYGQVEISDSKPERNITDLSHSIVLNKKSRLVISATIGVKGPFCLLGCNDGGGWFLARINNIEDAETLMHFSVQHDQTTYFHIINYMIDLNPGTHKIEFIVHHKSSTGAIYPSGKFSSIMVIPL